MGDVMRGFVQFFLIQSVVLPQHSSYTKGFRWYLHRKSDWFYLAFFRWQILPVFNYRLKFLTSLSFQETFRARSKTYNLSFTSVTVEKSICNVRKKTDRCSCCSRPEASDSQLSEVTRQGQSCLAGRCAANSMSSSAVNSAVSSAVSSAASSAVSSAASSVSGNVSSDAAAPDTNICAAPTPQDDSHHNLFSTIFFQQSRIFFSWVTFVSAWSKKKKKTFLHWTKIRNISTDWVEFSQLFKILLYTWTLSPVQQFSAEIKYSERQYTYFRFFVFTYQDMV